MDDSLQDLMAELESFGEALDSERSHYTARWSDLRRVLRPGGLLIVDNATSHPHEVASLVTLVSEDADFTACLVPVGKGEYLAVKSDGRAVPAAQLMSGNCDTVGGGTLSGGRNEGAGFPTGFNERM